MANLPLPLPKEKSRARTNLYIKRDNKMRIAQIAQSRYSLSLSEFTNQLYEREISLKGGLLRAKLSTR